MKTRRKIATLIIVVVIATISISAVWYFSPRTFLSGVKPSDVKSISVFDGNTGKSFVIDDFAEIECVVENIRNIKMKRYKTSVGYSGFGFRISFNNNDGGMIDSFVINSTDTIRDDPFFYCCNGGLCFDYLKELENMYAK